MPDAEDTPLVDVAKMPFGWEPIADFVDDLPEAQRFSKDQRNLGERVAVVTNWRGNIEVWGKRIHCWPWIQRF